MLRKWGEVEVTNNTGEARIHQHYSASLILLLILIEGMVGIQLDGTSISLCQMIDVCFKEREKMQAITDGQLPWCVGGYESGSLLITNTGRCFLIVKSIS